MEKKLELNGTPKLPIYANDVNLLDLKVSNIIKGQTISNRC